MDLPIFLRSLVIPAMSDVVMWIPTHSQFAWMTNALSSLPRTLPRRLEASSFITLLFTARFGSFICGKSSTYGSVVLLLPLYTPSPSTRRINAAQPGLMMIIFFLYLYTYYFVDILFRFILFQFLWFFVTAVCSLDDDVIALASFHGSRMWWCY